MTLTPSERQKLFQTLKAIAPEQLDQIIFTLSPPVGIIPPLPASQSSRVAALLHWAEAPGGCTLSQVKQILETVISSKSVFNSFPHPQQQIEAEKPPNSSIIGGIPQKIKRRKVWQYFGYSCLVMLTLGIFIWSKNHTKAYYTELRSLLSQKKWQEADEKTWDLMLAVANRQKKGYLDGDSIYKFSCDDLRMIDREWLNASGGKFGFSVQLAIYKQTGNTPGSYNEEAFYRFGDAVGWRKNGTWIDYYDLTWSTDAPSMAPTGHLPSVPTFARVREGGVLPGVPSFLSSFVLMWGLRESDFSQRLATCKL